MWITTLIVTIANNIQATTSTTIISDYFLYHTLYYRLSSLTFQPLPHLLNLESVLVPELVLEMGTLNPENSQAEIRPEILELSTTGRYIRYGTAQEWSLLDSVTGQVYDDALVTPDEIRLIQIAPEESISSTVDRTNIVTCPDTQTIPYPCSGGIGISIPLSQSYQVQDIYWQSTSTLIVVTCQIEDASICDILNININPRGNFPRPSGEYMNDYVYDADFGVMAWAVDDYFLHFNMNSRYGGFDLSEYLDSPIASIEWGETLWYVER
ncbi:MAG: hypothetical protein Phog2KO_26050 [Phototrophicaceae bacterium]